MWFIDVWNLLMTIKCMKYISFGFVFHDLHTLLFSALNVKSNISCSLINFKLRNACILKYCHTYFKKKICSLQLNSPKVSHNIWHYNKFPYVWFLFYWHLRHHQWTFNSINLYVYKVCLNHYQGGLIKLFDQS